MFLVTEVYQSQSIISSHENGNYEITLNLSEVEMVKRDIIVRFDISDITVSVLNNAYWLGKAENKNNILLEMSA